ncbi:MAG: hypothetical protein Q9159_006881 [Coniocarpon cinnabarinum]
MAMTKYKVSPVFVLAAGGILQTIGTSLFSYLPVSGGVTAANYGYETLIGVGGGFNIGGLILLTPFVVKGKDQAVAMGAINQFRVVGGAIGLAICTNIMSAYLREHLAAVLPPEALNGVLESISNIDSLSSSQQATTRSIVGDSINLQMKTLIAFSAAQIPAAFLLWGSSASTKENAD